MATFTKRGKTWRVQLYTHGQRVSKIFPTKAEAQAWASEAERKIRAGRLISARRISDLLDRYGKEITPFKDGAEWQQKRLLWLDRQVGRLPVEGSSNDGRHGKPALGRLAQLTGEGFIA